MEVKQYDPKVCIGQYSIQREVNNIARHEHPLAWKLKINDATFRDEAYQQLRAGNSEWCDYRAGTCYCDVEVPVPLNDLAAQVNEMFPA